MNLDYDKARHLYVIGQTGVGKSTHLENLIAQDLRDGNGVAIIDPHGALAYRSLSFIPKGHEDDLYWINPSDLSQPIAYNPLDGVPLDFRARAADNIVMAFKHVWPDSWGPQMEWIFVNTVRLVLDHSLTLLEVRRSLMDEHYRERLLKGATDPINISFWRDEFLSYEKRPTDPTTPILNKLGRVLSSPHLRNILCQKSTLKIRERMDERRILIANLSGMGATEAHLFGALLVSGIADAAFSRPPNSTLPTFHVYVDEFQKFATESFGHILSEARKFNLALTLSHQFLAQLPEGMRAAVLGNVGSVIAFRLGGSDAPAIAKQIIPDNPEAWESELKALRNYHAYARLLKNGMPTYHNDVEMLPPPQGPGLDPERLIGNALSKFGRDRVEVEAKIKKALGGEDGRR